MNFTPCDFAILSAIKFTRAFVKTIKPSMREVHENLAALKLRCKANRK